MDRLERLREGTIAAGLDAYLATSDESIAYLTGFRPMQLERFFGVVVPASGAATAIVPRLDAGQVEDPVSYGAESDGLPELIGVLGDARRVGVEESHVIFARTRALSQHGIEAVPAETVLMDLRARKEAGEIEGVRAACALVEAGLSELFATLRPGDVEAAVNARVEAFLRERGASEVHPLILFGANAANPHGQPSSAQLQPGDVVCADLSACLDGYWGDLTRCATAGPPSDWASKAWAVVRQAQADAIAACRVGVPARDVDAAQRRVVEARPDLGECLHGAGHAIGLAIHEPPFLVPRTQTPLAEGMIFTVEPGLYQRGVGGIRLEDDVVVRDGEPEILSTLPLELREL